MGRWSTVSIPVCGDDWDESEAAVACRQLGFVGEGIELRIVQYIVSMAVAKYCC